MSSQIDIIWNAAAAELKEKVSSTSYEIFFKDLKPLSVDEDMRLVLQAQNSVQKKFLELKFGKEIKEALSEAYGFDADFVIVCEDDSKTETEIKKEPVFKKTSDSDFYTFDNFMVGESNKYAYSVCRAVAENPGTAYNPLFLHGGTGLGKTHLLKAIKNQIEKDNPDYTCYYLSSESYTNEFIESLRNHTTHEFKNKYRSADVLLIDDVQFFAGKESTQEEFFHTYNFLKEGNKQIILASDRPPKDIHPLEERLCGRFESGALMSIEYPELELRVAIVKNKAKYYNVNISDEVAYFIAETIKNNIRKIEGVINKTKADQFIKGTPPTVSSVKSIIKDISEENEPLPVLVDRIITEVARVYDVKPEDIKSKKRQMNIKNARHVSIYIIREMTSVSLKDIGGFFSNLDHSSVHHAYNAVAERMESDETFRVRTEEMMRNIKEQ